MIKATLVTIGAMLALQIAGVLAGIAIFEGTAASNSSTTARIPSRGKQWTSSPSKGDRRTRGG